MKMLHLSLLFSLLFGNSLLANLPGKEKGVNITVCAYLGGEIGIKSKGCRGLSLSCVTIDYDVSLLADNINTPPPPPPGKTSICFRMKTGASMNISFVPEKGEEIRDFVIEKQTLLDSKLSNRLGYPNIKLIPGVYKAILAPDGRVNVDMAVSTK